MATGKKRNPNVADETPGPKVSKTFFGKFATATLDSFISKAPNDILEMIIQINRCDRQRKIAEKKKNNAKDEVELAYADFWSDVEDVEHQTRQYITSIAVHNDFERVTRDALNEALFMTNKVTDYINNRYNKAGAFADYNDLYEMQADFIKQMRAAVYSSADFIFMLAQNQEE